MPSHRAAILTPSPIRSQSLLDHVAEMNADAKLDATVGRDACVAFDHSALHFDGAAYGVDHAAKLDQRPVAGPLEHTSVVHGDGGVDHIAAYGAQPRQRSVLVRAG